MTDYIDTITSCKTDELLGVTVDFLDKVENAEEDSKAKIVQASSRKTSHILL